MSDRLEVQPSSTSKRSPENARCAPKKRTAHAQSQFSPTIAVLRFNGDGP